MFTCPLLLIRPPGWASVSPVLAVYLHHSTLLCGVFCITGVEDSSGPTYPEGQNRPGLEGHSVLVLTEPQGCPQTQPVFSGTCAQVPPWGGAGNCYGCFPGTSGWLVLETRAPRTGTGRGRRLRGNQSAQHSRTQPCPGLAAKGVRLQLGRGAGPAQGSSCVLSHSGPVPTRAPLPGRGHGGADSGKPQVHPIWPGRHLHHTG